MVVAHDGAIPAVRDNNGKHAQSEAFVPSTRSEELKEFINLTAYLYVCFAAVIYFKVAILQAQGIAYAPLASQ